jgi:hypothetical protein
MILCRRHIFVFGVLRSVDILSVADMARQHSSKNQNDLIFVCTLFVGELCHSGVLCPSPTRLWCAAGITDKLKCLRGAISAPPINFIIQLM